MFSTMSMSERKVWGSLAITIGIFIYFLVAILEDFNVVDLKASALLGLYIEVIILFAVLEIGHAIYLMWRKPKTDFDEDERDNVIIGKGSRNGFWITLAAIEAFIFMMILQKMYPDLQIVNLPFESASDLTFSMFLILFVGTIGKYLSSLFFYRKEFSGLKNLENEND